MHYYIYIYIYIERERVVLYTIGRRAARTPTHTRHPGIGWVEDHFGRRAGCEVRREDGKAVRWVRRTRRHVISTGCDRPVRVARPLLDTPGRNVVQGLRRFCVLFDLVEIDPAHTRTSG